MKNLMGIELDPMENIIVATSHDRANESNCDLEIFNAKGKTEFQNFAILFRKLLFLL